MGGHTVGDMPPAHALRLQESVSLVRKYSSFLDIPVAACLGQQLLVLNLKPWRSLWAMAQHRSQLVW